MGCQGMDVDESVDRPRKAAPGRGWLLGLLLAATFLIRFIHIDQPIVENYVGRQIPTAMVARNLERGSGMLRPRLDTAPFPNYFLVEPPLIRSRGRGPEADHRLDPGGIRSGSLGDGDRGCGLGALRVDESEGTLPSSGAIRRRGVRGLPDHDSIWPRLPTRCRHARRLLGGPGLLGSIRIRRTPVLARLRLVAAGAGIRDQDQRRIPAASPGSGNPPHAANDRHPHGLCDAPAGALVVRLGRPPPRRGSGSRASADNRAIWLGLLGPSALASRLTWEFVFRFSSSGHSRHWDCSWRLWVCFDSEEGARSRVPTPITWTCPALTKGGLGRVLHMTPVQSRAAPTRTIRISCHPDSGAPGCSQLRPSWRCWPESCITNTIS